MKYPFPKRELCRIKAVPMPFFLISTYSNARLGILDIGLFKKSAFHYEVYLRSLLDIES